MKEEIKANKENYSKELKKQIEKQKKVIEKILRNTEEGLIIVNEKTTYFLGSKHNLKKLFTMLVAQLYKGDISTGVELIDATKKGIEFAKVEKEMKKDKEFEKKINDLLNSIKKFMED